MTSLSTLLPTVPTEIVDELESSYSEIKKNFREGRYEPSELDGAKFCEVVYRLLEWYTSTANTYTPFGSRINNFEKGARDFGNLPSAFPDSIRLHIPRVLIPLYSIRNNRGVGHVGGDVNPNYMDAVYVVSACDWVLAELIRVFHNVEPAKAARLVQGIVTKKVPLIWEVGTIKRVLDPNLSYTDKALALLYSEYPGSVSESTLLKWVEHSNPSVFREDILLVCHRQRLIEYNKASGKVTLSPVGVAYVERKIKLEL